MPDTFESLYEAIKQSNEAYATAISALSKAVQNLPAGSPSADSERVTDHIVRLARLSKNAVVAAIEQGFEMWESQVRRIAAPASGQSSSKPDTAPSNPIEAWSENWRKASEAFVAGAASEDVRKQAEAVQNAFLEGIRAWQRLWDPEKR